MPASNSTAKITTRPLSPEPLIKRFYRDDCGALVTFIGTIRNTDKNSRKVIALEIEPTDQKAEKRLKEITAEVRQKWQLQKIAVQRRIGKLKVGEIALVVVIAATRRKEAFDACQNLIDRIKMGEITREKDIYQSEVV
jgi:molybdopterin synthase catalytic subunit